MIYLFQNMSWAKLCWDLSWAKKIELSKLLPQVHHSYSIELEWDEYYVKGNRAFFLWQPPHSELNGWFDKRPSKILKSHILEETLKNYSWSNRQFDF